VTTVIHRRVDALREGKDPTFVARLASGWAVLGERQVLPGYCLLLPDPVVPTLNALGGAARAAYLADMAALGDAVLAATRAARINYAILGNQDPALHAHVFPRFRDEPAEFVAAPPFAYDWNAAPAFDADAHRELRDRIHAALGAARGDS
jgi:diadenosine tetraphosphate (Ap4A) HIT family hydrolase